MRHLSFTNITLSIVGLALLWISMSGFFDLLHLSYGVISIAIVLFVNYQLKKQLFFEDELESWSSLRFGRFLFYLFWLLWQIVLAGFYMAYIIIHPRMPVEPYVLKFKADLPNTQAKVILGNSITLTPGTLTVDIEGNYFTIHALAPKSYESLVNDEMPRQVLALFEKESRPVLSDLQILDSDSHPKSISHS